MELNISEQKQRKKSTTKMALTKEEIEKIDPEEVFEWDVETLDAALKELNVTIGSSWSKSKKEHELTKAISGVKPKDIEIPKNSDPNVMIFQALQLMQDQMKQDREAQRQDR